MQRGGVWCQFHMKKSKMPDGTSKPFHLASCRVLELNKFLQDWCRVNHSASSSLPIERYPSFEKINQRK